MRLKGKIKSVICTVLALTLLFGAVPFTTTYAAQHNEYTDPADVWMTANGRTNELDMNATITYETSYCTVCGRDTLNTTYRVPEYTKSGETALNRNVKFSDGTCLDGVSKGNLDSGVPGQDAYYTGYHFTKSVCQTCGTINAVDGSGAYNFNRNVYTLNNCDHNFFLDFDATTYEPYDEQYHNTVLKAGKYCQFCKGTKERGTNKREAHDFTEVVDAQIGNNRFYIHQHCDKCDYETSEYVTAKSVISSYYGNVDGEAHTLIVSDLSDRGVKTSIRYGNSADNCNLTSAPNYTQAGYNTVYYKITYTYDGESMTENGVSYVWLLDEPETNITILMPDKPNDKHEHDYRYIETVPPTCDTLGYERWQCADCGDLEKKNYTPMTGHNYETVIVREANCKQGGLTLHLCKDCGDFYTETTPMGNHHYHTKTVNPTCQSVGYTEHTCGICGDTYITDIQPLTAHTFKRITKEPTCTDKGYTTSTCLVCDLTYVSDYTEPTGHDWDEGHTVTNSTCEGEGVIEYHCKNCDEKMINSTSPKGHVSGAPATCTEPQKCLDCGTILQLPKGHNYESAKIAPTCTEMGYTIYRCKDCGDTYTADYTDEIPHHYHKTVTEPTCTSNGYTTYVCEDCGDKYVSDYTDKKPHNFKSVVTKPTCTEFGFTTYTCEDCGETYVSDYTDKLPHNYSKRIISPTCTEHGYTVYTCPDCGNEYIGDITDCEQHNYKETVIAPTCTEMGYSVFKCENCGDEYKGNYTDASGHKLSDWIIDITATIEHSGSKHIECTACGKKLKDVEIPQLTDTDRTDEDGNAEVGKYAVLVTDKDGIPVFNSEIVIDVNDNITIKLPQERLLDYADQTTVTVMDTVTNKGVKDIRIIIFDGNNNAATGITDENGQVKFPNNSSNTGDDNGTIGKDNDEAKETFVVRVTDKLNTIIPDCDIYLGESNNIVVDLPAGIRPTREEPFIIIVTDQNGVAQKGITIIAIGDNDYIEKGKTDVYGRVTLPITDNGYTDDNGKVNVEQLNVIVNDETELIPDAYVVHNDDGTISVTLPDNKTISYDNRITVTVVDSMDKPVKNITVTVKDKTEKAYTDNTDENGKIVVPPLNEDITDNDGNSGVSETTTQDGNAETPSETVTISYKIIVNDTEGIIGNAFVKIEDGKFYVTLPEGKTLTTSNQTTVTVLDNDDKPVKDVFVTVTDKNNATATKTTDSEGKITVPVKTSSGGSSGRSSGGGGGTSSANIINVKITDKDGKNVTGFSKTTDKDGNVIITLPNGKTINDKDYYTITVTNGSGVAKPDITVTLKDKSNNTASGNTDKNGVVILPGEEHKAYIVGYDDGTFRPENDMTRAEAATIFARLVSDKKGERISGNSKFDDVSSNDWFAKEVGYLERYNIIKGYEDNTFKPDEAVTRAEFVTMAVRYYKLFENVSYPANTTKYTDINGSHWAIKDVSYATSVKWLNGYADGSFKPDTYITRAEVVTVVNRATGRNADESYINKNLSVLNKFTDLKNNSHWAYYDIMESANTHKAVNSADGEVWFK